MIIYIEGKRANPIELTGIREPAGASVYQLIDPHGPRMLVEHAYTTERVYAAQGCDSFPIGPDGMGWRCIRDGDVSVWRRISLDGGEA